MEPEARIHTYNVLKLDEMLFMYAPGVVAHASKVQNFIPKLNTLHHLLLATLTPRIGDATACPQYERNLIQFYVEKKPFSVFDFILVKILSISRTTLCSCGYAPQIMMMIEKVTGIAFVKDVEITDLKPQFPVAPIITMDVPSTSADPRSGMTAPPSSSSSSIGGILRVLNSMFCMCRDTRQCQDVLLSNQRRQNEKLGLIDFNKFPLPEPHLDEDPFASLSATDLVAMETTITDKDDNE
jgi:hypothetical protein